MKYFDTSNLRGDIFGGITAGIVALPLALAFGEASGAGPIAGMWGAIFVGFFAALFGGTGSQVSGPTGPMVVVFAGVFASLSGRPELVFAAVVLAGLIQIGLGFMKMGQYIRLVPYPVVSGFMSGIGCIIIALQVSRLFGIYLEDAGVSLRGTYIISPDGTLMNAEVNFLNMGRNIDELMRKYKANLYLAKKTDEGCPSKWKDEGDATLKPGPDMVGRVHEALSE